MGGRTHWPGIWAVLQGKRGSETRAGLSRQRSVHAAHIPRCYGSGVTFHNSEFRSPTAYECERTEAPSSHIGILPHAVHKRIIWNRRIGQSEPKTSELCRLCGSDHESKIIDGRLSFPIRNNRNSSSSIEPASSIGQGASAAGTGNRRGDSAADPAAADLKICVVGCYDYFLVVTVDFSTVTGTAGFAGAAVAGLAGAAAGSTAVGALLLSVAFGVADFIEAGWAGVFSGADPWWANEPDCFTRFLSSVKPTMNQPVGSEVTTELAGPK